MNKFTDSNSSAPDRIDPGGKGADADTDTASRRCYSPPLARHGFEDALVIPRDRAPELCHERRLKIVDYLLKNEPPSVSALSRALDYNKGEMSRDLRILENIDVVALEEIGKSKVPRLKHSRIVIEPIVSPDSHRDLEE